MVERYALIENGPGSKFARKGAGKEGKLSYNGNLPVKNRNRPIINTEVLEATEGD
jgi:hypothetical protein